MLDKHLPKLDLHGEIGTIASIMVNDFIKEQYMLGHAKVIIVHGMGRGILRRVVHEALSKNKLVCNYKLDMFNLGSTTVEIIVDNK